MIKDRVSVVMGSLVAVWVGLHGERVSAFSQPSYYPRAAALGGGGGRWFTGSASDGFDCKVCHTGPEGGPAWPVHVTGLPPDGYVPGQRYDVLITWPEFSARADQLRAAHGATSAAVGVAPGAGPELAGPDLSVLAELGTTDGQSAGRVEMDYDNLDSPERRDEWCLHLDGVPASQLFDTATPAPDQPVLDCTPEQPGQRCVLATQVCGARTLRFGWVAPARDVGLIWFRAALVATDALNADPTQDAVTTVAQPLAPALGSRAPYVSEITHGCSVTAAAGGARGRGLTQLAAFCVCAFAGLRRGRKVRKDHG